MQPLYYTIGLKTAVLYEHIKIAFLPSFTLSLSDHILSIMRQSAPTSSALWQSSALQHMWAWRPGDNWEREHTLCSWRMRPVFQRQVTFCPKVVIRPHKHFINSVFNTHTFKHTHADTSCFEQHKESVGERRTRARPTSVVWHSSAQPLSAPSQISHTSPPAPGQTVCASQ